MEYEQLDIFSYLQSKEEKQVKHILSVGDKIGRNVLGETRIAIVTEVEGLPDHPFYRTDSGGCYSYDEGLKDIEKLLQIDNQKKLMNEYEKHKKEILDDTYCAVHILDEEKPMRRLYWSNHHGIYADAEYVHTNG